MLSTALWTLSAVFAVQAGCCLWRLTRVPLGPGPGVSRAADLAELLLAVAMLAMVSPVGGPIPAAGWQVVLGLALFWLLAGYRRGPSAGARLHHALCAAAMLGMLCLPGQHGGSTTAVHGPWLNMSTMDGQRIGSAVLWWPVLALVGYLLLDAAGSLFRALRGHRLPAAAGTAPDAVGRALRRGVLGAGMAAQLLLLL